MIITFFDVLSSIQVLHSLALFLHFFAPSIFFLSILIIFFIKLSLSLSLTEKILTYALPYLPNILN